MPTSWGVYKNLLVGDWPVLCGREQAFQGPPRTSQHIAACQSSTAKILFEDPKVLLVAELGPWPWRLQEGSHGTSVQAPSRQGSQSGCWQRPRQLVNVGLDSSNKAEAAYLFKASSKPTSLAFLVGAAVPPRHSQIFWGDEWEMEPRETTCEKKNRCTGIYICHWKHFLNVRSEQWVQKDGIAICVKCNWARKPSWFRSKIS